MVQTKQKLVDLQTELQKVIAKVEAGKLTKSQAADRIAEIRESMDKLINAIKGNAGKE